MDKHRKLAVAGLAAAMAASAFVGSAQAADQVVNTSINSSIAMSTAPDATVNLGALNPGDTGIAPGGTLGVTANIPYRVTVASSSAKMTGTAGNLTADLAIAATTSTGTGAGLATTSTVAKTAATPIASGAGLTDDSYALELSQLASVTDAPGSYSLTLTYTAGPAL